MFESLFYPNKRGITRKRSRSLTIQDLIRVINDRFQQMMRGRNDNSKHLFFESIYWWKNNYSKASKEVLIPKSIPKKYDYHEMPSIVYKPESVQCSYMPSKQLSKGYLDSFYELLMNPKTRTYGAIQKKCHEMTEYFLPATVTSLEKPWKEFDTENAMNVMILGAGPVGLYTALLLNKLYNYSSHRKVNILLVDTRIHKEGLKAPYSRSTQFGFNISELQTFLTYIFCWNMGGDEMRKFDYIHVLENLLYTVAYHEKIPMIFTRQFEEYSAIEAFVEKEKIHAVFDCTGGRLAIPLRKTLPWSGYSFKEGNQEVKLNRETNYYEFFEDGKRFTRPTLRLQLFDKEMKEILRGNIFAYPEDDTDIAHIEAYKDQCFSVDTYVKLSSHFSKEQLRQLFPRLTDGMRLSDIHVVKMVMFNSIARHSPFAAAKVNSKCAYIRLGDALGGTEYGIVFGMKHSIEFSRYICNILSTFV